MTKIGVQKQAIRNFPDQWTDYPKADDKTRVELLPPVRVELFEKYQDPAGML